MVCFSAQLIRRLHSRRRPGTVNDGSFWPIGAHVEREVRILRRWQPIFTLARIAWFVSLHINRQRAVFGKLQILVFRADRMSFAGGAKK